VWLHVRMKIFQRMVNNIVLLAMVVVKILMGLFQQIAFIVIVYQPIRKEMCCYLHCWKIF